MPWLLGGAMVLVILIFVGVGLNLVLAGDPGGLILIAGGVIVGGASFAAFVRRTRVEFDRAAGRVRVTRRTVLGTKSDDTALEDVLEAELEASRSSEGGTTRRAVLRLRTGGTVVMDPVYVSGRGPGRTAETINRWLRAASNAAGARSRERGSPPPAVGGGRNGLGGT